MIGVFDSGSGGLTILEALQRHLPDEDFLYLGDHANAPYGHRSNAHIVEFTQAGVAALMDRGCRLVILACNTAAAVALRTLQQDWLDDTYPGNRILGVLVPMVEAITGVPWSNDKPVHDDVSTRTIAMFATKKTVESGAYSDEVAKRAPHIKLISKACPGLVDAIEGGAGEQPLRGLINGYVNELISDQEKDIEAAILGCTHFPLVEKYFRQILPDHIELFSQPEIVAHSLKQYLERHPEFSGNGTGKTTLLTTGSPSDLENSLSDIPDMSKKFKQVKF